MPQDQLYRHLWRHVCDLDRQRRGAWSELTDPAAVKARQVYVRQAVQEMIGPFPERCDLAPVVGPKLQRDGYTVEPVVIWSRPGFAVTCSLYLPDPLPEAKVPGVVFACGHSAEGRLSDVYQTMQIALVKQGFAVLGYDPISQGERIQYLDENGKPRLRGCTVEHCMAGNQLELVGASMANIRIWDGIRAHDYLRSRPEVDETRTAATGNSGGGTLSTYLLCLDDRYAAGAPSCYITTLPHRIATRMAADSEQQFTPMLVKGIDHADLLLPLAPKPLLICAAKKDFFPIEGARLTHRDLRAVYQVMGQEANLGLCEADEQHGFTKPLREGVVRWFRHHLQGIDTPYQEPEIQVETDLSLLWATTTGNVLTCELPAVTIHELVQRDFPISLACRSAEAPAEATVAKLAELLAVCPAEAQRPLPQPVWARPTLAPPPGTRTVRTSHVTITTEADIELPGLLFEPVAGAEYAVVMVPDEEGSPSLTARDSQAYQLAERGCLVLAVDPRGVGRDLGEMPPGYPPGRYYDFYGIEVEMCYTSWMIGRPLLGQRVHDVLCAVRWLQPRGLPVSVAGLGLGGVPALLAAALEPNIADVAISGMLASWQSVYDAEIYDLLPSHLLPGALGHLDLPDVAAAIAPRALHLNQLIDATRQPMPAEQVAELYAPALAAYEAAGASERLTISVTADMVVHAEAG